MKLLITLAVGCALASTAYAGAGRGHAHAYGNLDAQRAELRMAGPRNPPGVRIYDNDDIRALRVDNATRPSTHGAAVSTAARQARTDGVKVGPRVREVARSNQTATRSTTSKRRTRG
jgi:hypothetical protein